MIHNLSPALRQHLAEWLAWVDAGAIDQPYPGFDRQMGLCCSFTTSERDAVFAEFKAALVAEFGYDRASYPFNGSFSSVLDEISSGTIHRNPRRIAWVRKQLAAQPCQPEPQP